MMSDAAKEIKLDFQKAINVCDTISSKQSEMMQVGADLSSQTRLLCQSWRGNGADIFKEISEEQSDVYIALLAELKSLELSLREITAKMKDLDYKEAMRLGVQEQ